MIHRGDSVVNGHKGGEVGRDRGDIEGNWGHIKEDGDRY